MLGLRVLSIACPAGCEQAVPTGSQGLEGFLGEVPKLPCGGTLVGVLGIPDLGQADAQTSGGFLSWGYYSYRQPREKPPSLCAWYLTAVWLLGVMGGHHPVWTFMEWRQSYLQL